MLNRGLSEGTCVACKGRTVNVPPRPVPKNADSMRNSRPWSSYDKRSTARSDRMRGSKKCPRNFPLIVIFNDKWHGFVAALRHNRRRQTLAKLEGVSMIDHHHID